MMAISSNTKVARETAPSSVDAKSFPTVDAPSTIKVELPGIQNHQRLNSMPKREHSSMEDDTVLHEAKRLSADRVLSIMLLSPKVDMKETVHKARASYNKQSVVTNSTSTASSTKSCSPVPICESAIITTNHSMDGHSDLAPCTYKHRPTSFADMTFLQASASLAHVGGLVPPPLTGFEGRQSSNVFLLSQPMITSPSPSLFLLNGSAGKFLHSTPSRTPIRNGTFYRSIFSPPSTFSSLGRSNDSNFTGRTSQDDIISPALAFAAHFCDPIDVAKKDFTPLSTLTTTQVSEESGTTSDVIAISAARSIEALARTQAEKTTNHRVPLTIPRHVPNGGAFSSYDGGLQSVQSVVPVQGLPLRSKTFPVLSSKVLPVPTVVFEGSGDGGAGGGTALFCTCPKSRCLKLYCVCFQRNSFCDKAVCKCKKCKNNKEECGENGDRTKAMESIKKKKPAAFETRVKKTERGCRCKRNRCLKKYCVCFSEGNNCDQRCKCLSCHNKSMLDSTEGEALQPEHGAMSNPHIIAV